MSGVKRKEPPAKTSTNAKKPKTVVPKVAPYKGKPSTANGEPEKASQPASSMPKQFKLETSSAEAHAKQRALAKERRANKPNADGIQRSKKIWERLRRKSHVPPAERKELVTELFSLITGQIHDFVFKHDSVRVIQCALKYANQEQRRQISRELAGSLRSLAESRYAKFLVAKLVQDRDEQIRDAVIPEFYGHVRRLINHPEASWIVDDIYRQVATSSQKAMMLREWYGAEFALFHRKADSKGTMVTKDEDTAELNKILEIHPEKRKPVLQYLLQMINSLIQKKMTGFTMLHDAMLQYFSALSAGSPEHAEFLEILKGDIDPETEGGGGDLFRNLSFTKSGSQLVCLALAYSNAKDRKTILRCFRDNIELMAFDQYAKMVLLVGLDVPDDTKMSSRTILFELLGQGIEDEVKKLDRLEQTVTNLNARLPLLYFLAGPAKWLLDDAEKGLLYEVHKVRQETSKKAPELRRQELVEHLSEPLLELVAKRGESLGQNGFGCQFITETLLETKSTDKSPALRSIARLAVGDPLAEDHLMQKPAANRMLKTLVLSGSFDPSLKKVRLAEPKLGFAALLYSTIEERLIEWACSSSSFVVVAFLESEDIPENLQTEIRLTLKKARSRIEEAAGHVGKKGDASLANRAGKTVEKDESGPKANAGAGMLLEKIV